MTAQQITSLDLPPVGPLDVVVYHVGGDGGIGPIETLFETSPDNSLLVIFEIRDDDAPLVVEKSRYSHKQHKIKVNRAVDEFNATKDFHITNFPMSSSLFKPSPMASSEDPGYFHCRNWGENTRIEKTISVHVVDRADHNRSRPPAPGCYQHRCAGRGVGYP